MGFVEISGRIIDKEIFYEKVSIIKKEISYELEELMSRYGFKYASRDCGDKDMLRFKDDDTEMEFIILIRCPSGKKI